jgi:nucleoside-diphosphate-sugar epimerase
MHIFITGINGFIGSNLARSLLDKGCYVSGSVRKTSDLSFLKDLPVNLLTGEISDENFLSHCFKHQDTVFHVAALVSDWATVNALYKVNVQGTMNVARAALKANVKRLVFVSSTAVYGLNGYQNRKETDSYPEKNFLYAVTKRLAEDWLWKFSAEKKLAVTIVQPANVFGPYDRTFFIKFARALENRMMIFINKGKALTCPTYVENLTEALWLAATKEEAIGETFIISDGLNISWQQFVEKICQQLQVPLPRISINFKSAYALATLIEYIYKIFRIKQAPPITRYRVCNAGRDYHFSIEKAHRILGYSPRINLDEAIRRTVNWYRESFG